MSFFQHNNVLRYFQPLRCANTTAFDMPDGKFLEGVR